MKTYCDCNTCCIISCEERIYPEEEIDLEYEYEKSLDNAFHQMFDGDPPWTF